VTVLLKRHFFSVQFPHLCSQSFHMCENDCEDCEDCEVYEDCDILTAIKED